MNRPGPPPDPQPAAPPGVPEWHHRTATEVLAALGSTLAGLPATEAARRLAADGPNALKEGRRVGAAVILGRQFKSLIVWILVGAGVVSGLLGEVVDCLAILGIVVLNAAIGFHQESRAEHSITALKRLTAPRAVVRRDGVAVTIPATGIVAGDVLELGAGDLVGADARILESSLLRCAESALTGEAESVPKQAGVLDPGDVPLGDRGNMVFLGSSITGGRGLAVVVATGMATEMGRIAGLIEEAGAEPRTPLQEKLDAFGRILVWATLGIVLLLFGLGWWRGTKPLELFLGSVSLAVAAVPEGLPAVVTVALALGVLRMSRRGALVRQLPAVETLGATTVICTDKTGTLTVGEMTVRALFVRGIAYEVTGEGYGPRGEVRSGGEPAGETHAAPLAELAALLLGCNNGHLVEEDGVWRVIGDPTEGALLAAGAKAGGNLERLEREMPREHEIPFDSDRKRSTVLRRLPGGRLRAMVNGAPGILLERCTHESTAAGVQPLDEPGRRRILEEAGGMARRALRVLGSAYRDLDPLPPDRLTAEEVERDLVFVGLTGMVDPPRPEAREAVARCRSAGIRVVMITGDHPETAMAIAREIGIADDAGQVMSGTDVDPLSARELEGRVAGCAVYARVTAGHKLRIIRAWKATGAVVAMTGDGVNDAPAIQGADIGIAMGRAGTEVTKQASDIILTDDHFATIIAAVEEGRGIYDNIRKTLQYLLAGNTGELLLMTLAVVLGLPPPLLPIHLLWINLVTDGLPALCLATDPVDPDVMRRPPRPPSGRMTDPAFLRTMVLTGVLTAGVAFVVYLVALRTGSVEAARSQAFTVLVFAELFRSFGGRSETRPVWRIPFFSNPHLALVVGISVALQAWSLTGGLLGRILRTSPMTLAGGGLLLAAGLIPLAVLELVKAVRGRGKAATDA